MHVGEPELREPRVVLAAPDEIERLVDEAAGDFGTRQPFDRALTEFGALLAQLVGEVGRQDARAEAFPLGVAFVKAIGRRERRVAYVASAAEVPFAEMASGITDLPHHARQDRKRRVEPVGLAEIPVALAVVNIGDEAVARGEAARHEAGPRRRADRRRVIELRHHHPVARERVDVGRRDQLVAGQRQVGIAHVVDQDEQDVRLLRCCAGSRFRWRRSGGEAVGWKDAGAQHCEKGGPRRPDRPPPCMPCRFHPFLPCPALRLRYICIIV